MTATTDNQTANNALPQSDLEMFRLLCPLFADVPDAQVLAIMEVAKLTYSEELLPEKVRPMALAYMTAHILWGQEQTMQGGASAGSGVVQSEKEGDLSRSYAIDKSLASNALLRSSYGQNFDFLWKTYCGPSAIFTRAFYGA